MRKTSILKHRALLFALIAFSVTVFTGCVSSKIQKSIDRGDDITAIRLLSEELCKKPTNEKYAAQFAQVYPYAIETRYPQKSVDQVIDEALANYGINQTAALRSIAAETGSSRKLSSHPSVTSAISRSESIIQNLKDIILIQRYVAVMPNTVGNAKKGVLISVYKYTDDFAYMLSSSINSMAELYYNMGEALSSSRELNRMEEAYSYYLTADNYVSGYANINSKAAALAYEIGVTYQSKGGIINRKTALSWFQKCIRWDASYKLAQTKIYELNYQIAVELLASASSINDYEEALEYMNAAGDYQDARTQAKEITYQLAYAYRNKKTSSSYKKAGELFEQLGNYKNAANETTLYEFYKKLASLPRTDNYGVVRLNSGNPKNTFSLNLENTKARYATVNASRETSTLNVFANLQENQLYPGLILEGNSIAGMSFQEFPFGNREPLEYQIVSGTHRISSGTITNPGARTAGSQIKTEASRYSNSFSPVTDFEMTQVYSNEDLNLALGFGYGKNQLNIDQGLFYNDDTVLLLKVTQSAYEVSIDPPALPVDFFSVTGSVVNKSSLGNVTPYYVSSVEYGRCGYFIITSELSADELKRDLETLKPTGRYSTSYSKPLDSNILAKWISKHTFITGVSIGDSNYLIRNIDGIYNWLNAGYGSLKNVNSLSPISFTLRNLYNNDYAVLSQSVKTQVKNPNYTTESSGSSSGTGSSSGSSSSSSSAPAQGTTNNPYAGNIYASDNPYTSLVFVGPTGNVYECKYRDSTTYYYDINKADLAYLLCSWDTSRISNVRINGKTITKSSTNCDFSSVVGSSLSFDFSDTSEGTIHKLLVINSIN